MTPIRVATSLGAFFGRLAGGAMAWRSTTPNATPPAEAKASTAGPLIAFESLRQPVWTPRDYSAFAREGFMGNAIVYRCVRMTAETAASVPLLLYRGEEEIPSHPLLDLINHPNPIQVGPEFLEALFGHLLVAGNSYIEAVAIDGNVRELHALLRTLTTSSPAAVYTAADQAADFGTPPPAIAIRVYQLSASYGRGSPAAAAV